MLLYIVRHASAGEHGDPRYPDDSKRPLTDRGHEQFDRLVKRLVPGGFEPEVIGTSPYLRCRQTAQIVAARVADSPKPQVIADFAPGANLDGVLAWCSGLDVKQAAYVGHAPDVDLIASALIGSKIGSLHFVKGAIAAVRFDEQVVPGQGLLRWLVSPKLFD